MRYAQRGTGHGHHGGGRARRRTARGWAVRARVERFAEPAVLLLLREGPRHGYELLDDLAEVVGEEGALDLGNLYRLLRALEHEGLVTSEWRDDVPGPAKRTYALTPAGRRLLDRWAAALRRARTAIDGFITRLDEGR